MQRKMTWQLLLAALVSTLLLGGCTRTYTWKEEVTLKSGEKLLVQRSQKYDSGGGEWAAASLWNTLRQARIRIDGVPVEWVGYNYPMIIERWGGTYVVIYIGTQCYSFSRNDPRRYVPPYFIDVFVDGKWQDVDVFKVRETWPRNLVVEWREGGFLAGDQKARKVRSERVPTTKWLEEYDLSLQPDCRRPPSFNVDTVR